MTNDFERALEVLKSAKVWDSPGASGQILGMETYTVRIDHVSSDFLPTLETALVDASQRQAAIAAQNVAGVDVVAKKIRSAILFEIANAGYEDAADYIAGQYILEVIKEKLSLHAQSRQAVAEGYVSVPAIPTDEMTAAGIAYGLHTSVGSSWSEFVNGYYRAMLTAAPDAGEVG